MRPNTVHVYFDQQHPRYILGPIWIPQVGERHTLKGVEMEVTGIDLDGLAVAFSVEHMEKMSPEAREGLKNVRTGLPTFSMDERVAAKQKAVLKNYVVTQTKRNRERLAS